MEVYTRTEWGLYLARPTPGRAQFRYLQSWLLPSLGLRATVFDWNPGHERDEDFYLDVVSIDVAGDRWRTEDHYLDLMVYTGVRTDLVDVDELLEAHHMGLVDPDTAERALRCAVAAIDGLASHGHDLHRWLSSNGMDLTWR